jgi:hypothetical protein
MVEPEQVLCRDRRAGEAAASPCSRFGAWRRATSWQECMGSRLTPRPSFLRLKRCPLHGPGREGPLTKRGCVSAWLLGLTAACSSSSIASWCFVPPSSGTNEQCQQSTPVAIQTELGLGDGTTCPSTESSWQSGTCPTANLYGCCRPGRKGPLLLRGHGSHLHRDRLSDEHARRHMAADGSLTHE